MKPSRRSPTAMRRRGAASGLLIAVLLSATPALADHYDSSKAGHPLRVTAYLLHPIGVMVDTLIFRPAHWMVSHDGLRYWFGHTEK